MERWKLFYFDDEGCPEALAGGTLDQMWVVARDWMRRHVGEGSGMTETVIDDLSRVGARYAELPHGTLVLVPADF